MMHLIRHLTNSQLFSAGSVVTIGNFDGVHLGHVTLLKRLMAVAKQHNLPSVVVIFEPQPREVFHPTQAPIRLTPLREKIRLLAALSIDYVVCLRFTPALAALTAEEFVAQILVQQLQARHILIGDDFHFGKQRQGDIQLLTTLSKQYHFSVESIATIEVNGTRISSTFVRDALRHGDVVSAKNALGRYYHISGRVQRGEGKGRRWGFPTANLAVPAAGLPLSGVFVVYVSTRHLRRHPAVANIGTRPTVDGTRMVLEVLLLDFTDDLYGQRLEVEFLHKLRDEQKFASLDLLLQQIKQDVAAARLYFKL